MNTYFYILFLCLFVIALLINKKYKHIIDTKLSFLKPIAIILCVIFFLGAMYTLFI